MKEESFGIVPLVKKDHQWQVLLIQHGASGYWGFPKGHAEDSESPKETAMRELLEETNLEVVRFFSETPLEEHYQFQARGNHVEKTVWFFVAEVKGEVILQTQEVSNSRWVLLDQATEYLTYENDRSICRSAMELVSLL